MHLCIHVIFYFFAIFSNLQILELGKAFKKHYKIEHIVVSQPSHHKKYYNPIETPRCIFCICMACPCPQVFDTNMAIVSMLHKPLWQILNIILSESTIYNIQSNKIISAQNTLKCRELRTPSGVSTEDDLLNAISSWKSKRKIMHQRNSSEKLSLFLILFSFPLILYNFFL